MERCLERITGGLYDPQDLFLKCVGIFHGKLDQHSHRELATEMINNFGSGTAKAKNLIQGGDVASPVLSFANDCCDRNPEEDFGHGHNGVS